MKRILRWLDRVCARLGFLLPGAASRYIKNPLLKYPVNHPCYCGNLMKFKRCCKGKQPKFLLKDAKSTGIAIEYMKHVEGNL